MFHSIDVRPVFPSVNCEPFSTNMPPPLLVAVLLFMSPLSMRTVLEPFAKTPPPFESALHDVMEAPLMSVNFPPSTYTPPPLPASPLPVALPFWSFTPSRISSAPSVTLNILL